MHWFIIFYMFNLLYTSNAYILLYNNNPKNYIVNKKIKKFPKLNYLKLNNITMVENLIY